MKSDVRNTIIRLIVICMLMPFAMPILAYADSENYSLTVGDTEAALTIAPYENELGLMVCAADLAKAFSFDYEFDSRNKCFTINDDVHGAVILMHNATQFYSGDKTYECAPYFYVENGVPMIETEFFCTMFGASYDYDRERKNLNIYKGVPMHSNDCDISLMNASVPAAPSDAALSGTVTCSDTDLLGGIDVKLILQQTGIRYILYQGYETVPGSTYVLGTVHLNSGEERKDYSYDVSRYYSSHYPTYSLFFEETKTSVCGYYNNQEAITELYESPMYTSTYYPKSKTFSAASSETADITLSEKMPILSGTISVGEGTVIPADGIDVDLVMQTRSTLYTYTSVYGYSHSHYKIGKTYKLGTTHISQGDKSKDYRYSVLPYYTDSKYPLYTLFYSSADSDCVKPYGYYGYDGSTKAADVPPLYSDIQYLDSKEMILKSRSDANLVLPSKSSHSGESIKKPAANTESGNILYGTVITLSCECDGAEIYYTTDGSDPNPSKTKYTSGIPVYRPTILKAIAVKPGVGESSAATYVYNTINPTSPMITVNGDTGKPGQTVDVNVALSNNPGISCMRLKVEYDSDALTLIGVSDSEKLGNQIHSNNYRQNPYTLYWNNGLAAENYTADGDIVTLKFKIDDNAKKSNYPITVSYDNTDDDIFNIDFEPVDFYVINGKITVSEAAADKLITGKITECKFIDNMLTTDIEYSSCLTDCTAILAVYENNKLLKTAAQAVSSGESKTTLGLYSEKNLIGKNVKVFFLKTLGSAKPVGEVLKCVVTNQ